MSKGKRLVLALVLLVTFCTVAIAASPKVDSILQEHDVLVPFFLPRTLFTITPQGDDVTWSKERRRMGGRDRFVGSVHTAAGRNRRGRRSAAHLVEFQELRRQHRT